MVVQQDQKIQIKIKDAFNRVQLIIHFNRISNGYLAVVTLN